MIVIHVILSNVFYDYGIVIYGSGYMYIAGAATMNPWVCFGSFWKPWALHAGSSCHQRTPDAKWALLK